MDKQQRHLAVRFYCKWYCATSGVDVGSDDPEVQVGFKKIHCLCEHEKYPNEKVQT